MLSSMTRLVSFLCPCRRGLQSGKTRCGIILRERCCAMAVIGQPPFLEISILLLFFPMNLKDDGDRQVPHSLRLADSLPANADRLAPQLVQSHNRNGSRNV